MAPPLARRPLGKTGAMISIIGFGTASRFVAIEDEEEALALLERAFALGVNFFDTSPDYTRKGIERLSERRLGQFAKRRRNEIFIATKVNPRDRDGALRSVERSLEVMQTDYVDLIQIHALHSVQDLDRMGGPNGAVAALAAVKERKLARFVGITGHNDGAAMAEALRRYDFDAVLMALNAAQSANPVAVRSMEPIPAFEGAALATALEKKMGVLAMKTMAHGNLVGGGSGMAGAADLLRFNLSLPVAAAVVGIDQRERLEENIRVARAFAPMNENEKQKLRDRVAPSRDAWQRYLRSHDDSLPV
jgi:aryl-alcohol dehydrogenase-like predicted oxidoreductase